MVGGGAERRPVGGYVPLVEAWRGDMVESVHFGAIAVVDPEGGLRHHAGDPETPIYLRSIAKPAQALPLLMSGAAGRFGLTAAELAVIIGSHNGETVHLEAVRSILGKIGLGEDALLCGAHAPYHKPTANDLRRRGIAPSVLHNNCSGKHAGMLALAIHLGAPTGTYLEPDHPVQVRIRAAIEMLAGLPPGGARLATDGCSAPTFGMPLRAAALLYARLVAAAGGALLDPGARGAAATAELASAARRAIEAMRRHPEMIAGDDRLCTALIRLGRHGLVAKIGAEGVYGLGFASDGKPLGLALKIADGEGHRSRTTAVVEALRQLGVLEEDEARRIAGQFVGDLRNRRGLVVGRVQPVFVL